ncbi:MAG: PSD1 and planctomycete cytochrome C domain-containing protein [Planctomycetaceae bacterium]
MRKWLKPRHVLAIAAVVFAPPLAQADPDAKTVDFDRDVRPILEQRCVKCHGAEKQKSGLRLDTLKAATAGGDSGPAIEPGASAESLLVQALSGSDGVAKMPPKGEPELSADEIATLRAWIDQGARGPESEVAAEAQAQRSTHWSFQPVARPQTPEVREPEWVRTPIDAFILARLETEGLAPSPEADRVTLIRRLCLDLLGLLPSVAEVDEFLADERPGAYERLVERLLSSPHYGERWGRHWLDLARYADSNGFTRDFARTIWKYRDWVIDALNRDLPFDLFTIEQVAGDMLPGCRLDQLLATGFHRNTTINEEGGTDPEQFRVESVVDRVNTTGVVFLGLTVGCAQCHAHKYDPISQREYYQLFAFLNNAEEPKIDVPTEEQMREGQPQRRDELQQEIAKLVEEFKPQQNEFTRVLTAWVDSLTDEDRKSLPFDVVNAVQLSPEMRNDQHRKDLDVFFKGHALARAQFPLLDQIARLREQVPLFVTSMVMRERPEPRETYIHVRGDFLRHGAKVTPGVPAALPGLPEGCDNPNRLDFARWLVDSHNPLTPRVTVNRVWQKYFGRGIVETENDFGTQGARPTHPELLDWLAAEFVNPQCGADVAGCHTSEDEAPAGSTKPGAAAPTPWSLKHLHRLIVLSATYRQSSRHRADLAEKDANNKLYARQSRLRLDAEIIRDVALVASGLLNRTIGGPSVFPPQPEGVFDFTQDKKAWVAAIGPDRYRRAMYTYLWRSSPYPAMTVFDFPDANVTCTRRNRSNTPLQSLTLANDQQFLELAQGLAARVLSGSAREDKARLHYAFRICLSRAPDEAESARLEKLLALQKGEFAANLKAAEMLTPSLLPVQANVQEFAAWTAIARVLLNVDEFITRE